MKALDYPRAQSDCPLHTFPTKAGESRNPYQTPATVREAPPVTGYAPAKAAARTATTGDPPANVATWTLEGLRAVPAPSRARDEQARVATRRAAAMPTNATDGPARVAKWRAAA